MAAIQLQIVSPTHNQAFVGNGQVSMRGTITDLPAEISEIPLFYRWYSSLFPSEEDRYSINVAALTDPGTAFGATLGVGTHVLSLAGSDQSGEAREDQDATSHGGVAGGAEGDAPCIVHVLRANLVSPTSGSSVNRASAQLVAEAPLKWSSRLQDTDPYVPDAEYHKHNRLQYRWRFTPIGAPAGRPTVPFVPDLGDLAFDPEHASGLPAVLVYNGALPSAVQTGGYTLTLFVEDNDPSGGLGGDQESISITVT